MIDQTIRIMRYAERRLTSLEVMDFQTYYNQIVIIFNSYNNYV